MQQGFAGYSLIRTEGDQTTLGHDVYCPSCGNPIAEVRVSFLGARDPQPGSKLAILSDLARPAMAKEVAKKNLPTQPKLVVARN